VTTNITLCQSKKRKTICQRRFVPFVNDRSLGEKSGQKIGTMSSIAASVAKEVDKKQYQR
jgi:hypothetical protein